MAEALAQNVSRRILVSDCMILVWLWMRVCERSARDVRARRVRRNSREASDSSGNGFGARFEGAARRRRRALSGLGVRGLKKAVRKRSRVAGKAWRGSFS